MDVVIQTNEACLAQATAEQTRLALSKVRLFKSDVNLQPSTTAAELAAAECDFTGYTSGGMTVTAFLDPIRATEGGYAIQSPIVQFAVGSTPTVENVVFGWWLETASGDVVMAVQLDPANRVPMGTAGQGYPVSARRVFPNQ